MGLKLPAALKLWLICHEMDGSQLQRKINLHQSEPIFGSISQYSVFPSHQLTTAGNRKRRRKREKPIYSGL